MQISTILASARWAYQNTPDSDSKLRAQYLTLIIRSRNNFKKSGTMKLEMEQGGTMFFDLFVAMCNHIVSVFVLCISSTRLFMLTCHRMIYGLFDHHLLARRVQHLGLRRNASVKLEAPQCTHSRPSTYALCNLGPGTGVGAPSLFLLVSLLTGPNTPMPDSKACHGMGHRKGKAA